MRVREAATGSFLDDFQPIQPRVALPDGVALRGVYFRNSNHPELEIMVLQAAQDPRADALRRIWRERQNNRPAPLLVVALCGEHALLFGPDTEKRPVRRVLAEQAERLCRRALGMPDRHAALRFIGESMPGLDGDLPGIRNEGLLSEHELIRGATHREDWPRAQAKGAAILARSDMDLLHGLGFAIEKADGVTHLLSAGDRQRAVAVLLDDRETPEDASPRFQALSPVAWALHAAARRSLPWVVMVQQDRIRLYPVELGVGVGERGRTDTWIELRLPLLRQDQAGLLWLTVSAEALCPGGTLEHLLENSKRFAAELALRLRERIYDHVVPLLATGIAATRAMTDPGAADLRLTYGMALTLLFRLLFVAYAEDRDFLPYASNEAYRDRALKKKAVELARGGGGHGSGTRIWHEVRQLFEAVRNGDAGLGVPAYGGGLFATDPAISPAGAALEQLALADAVFVPALRALLLDEARDLGDPGKGPVDFRSLRVREFGTIYEGLLESELAVADTDLALKKQGKELVYLPAKPGDAVEVERRGIFLHNRSGARKSSGSYFTPAFAVDHLLDAALEPALQAHAERVRALDETAAAEAFFDIRIADIAMGSGHFLVAALDRVERKLSAILAERKLPGVMRELADLRAAAEAELKRLDQTARIENGQVLRRLIARRCIYGVDLNPLAVDLARLSIWVHTFVPGLPLSLLDHALVAGNSLVGIATVQQLHERFAASGMALFPVDAQSLLGDAAEPLKRLACLTDATLQDVEAGREAMERARVAVAPTRALCDLVVAERVAPQEVAFQFENWPKERAQIQAHPALARARKVLAELDVFHFPIAFPEVFLRSRPGFDVILGNPPWQEVTLEALGFWVRHFPGLKGLPEAERGERIARLRYGRPDLVMEYEREVAQTNHERAVLGAGFYPGMGTGDADLYKAFAWRFWQLAIEQSGHLGVVLPRSALAAVGSRELRESMFSGSAFVGVTTLLNRGGWVFAEAEHRYTMALLAVARGRPQGSSLALRGPYASRASWDAGLNRPAHRFTPAEVLGWTSSASLPLLPSDDSIAVFAQLRIAPRLDCKQVGAWRARPDRELDATNDKSLMKFNPPTTNGLWPVMKGESFDIWQNDRGKDNYYAWADPASIMEHLQAKRLRSAKSRRNSAHAEFPIEHVRDPSTLSCQAPRIAFRDVTNRTNMRTVIAALLPSERFIGNQAPYFVWPSGDEKDQAFLLGALCSVPLDWYARRFVETHLSFFLINPFPIPRPPRTDLDWQRVVTLAGRLACPDDRFAEWARAVGVSHGPLDPETKQNFIEELDAVVARLYGLSAAQLTHIFDTFHEWPTETQARAWNARRDRTLGIFRALP